MARGLAAVAAAAAALAVSAAAPNVVLFLTDDQDVLLDSMSFMPQTQQLLVANGMSFTNNFASVPVCCPSRASFWTGLHQQNTQVFNNSVEGNCGGLAFQNGPEQRALPVLLKAANPPYVSSFGGKYSNTYGNFGPQPRPGWDQWQGLYGNSRYYNFQLSNNGTVERHGAVYPDDYLPLIVKNRTLAWIDAVAGGPNPFLAAFSVPACHQPADPEPQYSNLYPGVQAPRHPNFNKLIADTHWFERTQGVLGPLDDNQIAFIDLLYRRRLQTLATVDQMVADTVALLKAKGVFDNTYIILTADNGYHLGQAGLGLDKRQPWAYDSQVPLIIMGPGVQPGTLNPTPVQHVDLVPTLLDLAGLTPPAFLDGLSLRPLLGGAGAVPLPASSEAVAEALKFAQPSAAAAASLEAADWGRQAVLYSYHGEGNQNTGPCAAMPSDLFCQVQGNVTTPPYFYGQPFCSCQDAKNSTYSCIRVVNASVNVRYCEFGPTDAGSDNGFVEFFDIARDPYEMTNLRKTAPAGALAWYSAELNALRTCSGAACNAY